MGIKTKIKGEEMDPLYITSLGGRAGDGETMKIL